MLKPAYTNQFQKDLKRMLKTGKDSAKLKNVMERLIEQKQLEQKHRNHKLIGEYKDRWECHIEPDWLLVYKMAGSEIIFERTGTHSELFE